MRRAQGGAQHSSGVAHLRIDRAFARVVVVVVADVVAAMASGEFGEHEAAHEGAHVRVRVRHRRRRVPSDGSPKRAPFKTSAYTEHVDR